MVFKSSTRKKSSLFSFIFNFFILTLQDNSKFDFYSIQFYDEHVLYWTILHITRHKKSKTFLIDESGNLNCLFFAFLDRRDSVYIASKYNRNGISFAWKSKVHPELRKNVIIKSRKQNPSGILNSHLSFLILLKWVGWA